MHHVRCKRPCDDYKTPGRMLVTPSKELRRFMPVLQLNSIHLRQYVPRYMHTIFIESCNTRRINTKSLYEK